MEYLTLDQKKKSLNIRVNDMKLDGSLSVNGEGGVSVFYQTRITLIMSASFRTTPRPVECVLTRIGEIITLDIPTFAMIANIGGVSRISFTYPLGNANFARAFVPFATQQVNFGTSSVGTLSSGNTSSTRDDYSYGLIGEPENNNGFPVAQGATISIDPVRLVIDLLPII